MPASASFRRWSVGTQHPSPVFGIEGPAWSFVKTAEHQPGEGPTDELIASAMEAARMAEPYPELLAASSHLLAVGRARD